MEPLEADIDADDDIDWDDIIDTTQPDIDAGIYAFTTKGKGYETDEEIMEAVWNWLCTLGHGNADETTDPSELHAPRP